MKKQILYRIIVIYTPIEAIGPWGFRAVIIDSEGNKIALHAMEDK